MKDASFFYIIPFIVIGFLFWFKHQAIAARNLAKKKADPFGLTEKDRAYLKDTMGIDPDVYPEFAKAMGSAREFYKFSLRELSKDYWTENDAKENVVALHNIGWAYEEEGHMENALWYYREALGMSKRLGFEDGIQILEPKVKYLAENSWKKITQDVRDYAAQQGVEEEQALEKGMEEMSETFKEKGSEIYQQL